MQVRPSFRGGRPLVAVALACAAAGCGAERANVQDLRPSKGDETRRFRFTRAGMSLELPASIGVIRRRPPSVFRGVAGTWSVSAFAYRRGEQLPRDRTELEAARGRLVREVRRGGRRFRMIRSRATRVAGAPAAELVGDQTISRSRLRIRSVHIYKGRAEYVLELLAPVKEFARAERVLFAPAIRSLRVTGEVKPARRARRRGR